LRLAALGSLWQQKLSTRSIVKKKRRKPQTSQDKAVATNYHSRQTSGKNQSREFFTIHFHNFFRNYSGGGEGSAGETPTDAGGTPALPGKLNSYLFSLFFGQYGSTQVVLRISKMDSGVFPALQTEWQGPFGSSFPGVVFLKGYDASHFQTRNVSRTLHAWASHPRAVWGASPSRISGSWPRQLLKSNLSMLPR
jgi:hypothetical protein